MSHPLIHNESVKERGEFGHILLPTAMKFLDAFTSVINHHSKFVQDHARYNT